MVSPAAKLFSPASGSMSVTPKAKLASRFRTCLSATPTPMPPPVFDDDNEEENNGQRDDDEQDESDGNDEWPMEDDWGDGAMLEWQAGPTDDPSGLDDDVSSVAPGDAGLPESETDQDEWGRDAYLAWDADGDGIDDGGSDDSDDPEDGPIAAVEETEADLVARGMPEYRQWNVKRLQVGLMNSFNGDTVADENQTLCEGYGYRTINKHDPLVELAIQCWKAINPLPTPTPRLKFRATTISTTSSRPNSVSSADVPLSIVKSSAKPKSALKAKAKGKGKATAAVPVVQSSQADVAEDLSRRFFRMIKDDQALWLRILRYEVSVSVCSSLRVGKRAQNKGFVDGTPAAYSI